MLNSRQRELPDPGTDQGVFCGQQRLPRYHVVLYVPPPVITEKRLQQGNPVESYLPESLGLPRKVSRIFWAAYGATDVDHIAVALAIVLIFDSVHDVECQKTASPDSMSGIEVRAPSSGACHSGVTFRTRGTRPGSSKLDITKAKEKREVRVCNHVDPLAEAANGLSTHTLNFQGNPTAVPAITCRKSSLVSRCREARLNCL